MHFFITGFMGSGKSYWAKQMAMATGLPCIDLDDTISEETGLSITDLFTQHGEAYFRQRELACLTRISAAQSPSIIACGGGLTCNPDTVDFMKEQGWIILIDVPFSILLQRLRQEKSSRPLLAHVSDDQFESYLWSLYQDRQHCYSLYDKKFELDSLDTATFAAYILSHA